jgi:hypothetical protein
MFVELFFGLLDGKIRLQEPYVQNNQSEIVPLPSKKPELDYQLEYAVLIMIIFYLFSLSL